MSQHLVEERSNVPEVPSHSRRQTSSVVPPMSSQNTSRPFSQSIGGRNLFKFKQSRQQHNIFSANNLNNSIQSAEEDLSRKQPPMSPISTTSQNNNNLASAKVHSTSRYRHVNIIDYHSSQHAGGASEIGTATEATPKISARALGSTVDAGKNMTQLIGGLASHANSLTDEGFKGSHSRHQQHSKNQSLQVAQKQFLRLRY